MKPRLLPLRLLACVFAIVLTGCSGNSGNSLPDTVPGPPVHREQNVDAALSELDALRAPSGVDSEVWLSLKDSLRNMLIASARSRFTSAAPTGAENAVDDLTLSLLDQQGTRGIQWTYRNNGDYDLNSEVNIADLTPIGLHFRKTTLSADWDVAQVADGDGNGEVNLADITPIGQNFLVSVTEWIVEGSATEDGSFTEVERIDWDANDSGAGLHYELAPSAEHAFYRVVPVDAQGNAGVESNVAAQLTLRDTTEFVGLPEGPAFISYDPASMTLILSLAGSLENTIAVGDTVLGGEAGGYLLKVLTVQQSGDQLTLTGEPGSFAELIASGVLQIEVAASDVAMARSTSAHVALDPAFDRNFDGSVIYDANGLKVSIPDGYINAKIEGEIVADYSLTEGLTGALILVRADTVAYRGTIEVESTSHFGGFGNEDDPSFTRTVSSVAFPLQVTVPGLDISIPVEVEVDLIIAVEGVFGGPGTYSLSTDGGFDDVFGSGYYNGEFWQTAHGAEPFTSSLPAPVLAPEGATTVTDIIVHVSTELRIAPLPGIEIPDDVDMITQALKTSYQLNADPTSVPVSGYNYTITSGFSYPSTVILPHAYHQMLGTAALFIQLFAPLENSIDAGFVPAGGGSSDESITGVIRNGPVAIAGITVSGELTGSPGSTLWTDITDVNGVYTLAGISTGLDVTVIPDPAGAAAFSFTPASRQYVVNSDINGADFTATPLTAWTHTVGFNAGQAERVNAIAGSADGSVYICGQAGAPLPSTEDTALVAKYSPSGQLLWSRQEGTLSGSAVFNALAVNAGGLYTVGSFYNLLNLSQEILVMKWDGNGEVLWKRSWSLGATSSGWIAALDTSGNLYVGGECSNGATGQDVAVLKYDSAGTLLWQKTYAATGVDVIRGGYYDAGNFYLTGHAMNGAGTPSEDVSLLKVFNDGSLVIDSLYDVGGLYNAGLSIQTGGSFDPHIGGSTVAAGGLTSEALLIRLNFSGAVSSGAHWKLQSPDATFHQFNAIKRDGFGNIYGAGYWLNGLTSQQNAALAKFDSGFASLASESFSAAGSTRLYAISQDLLDGDLLLGGYAPDASGSWAPAAATTTAVTVTQSAYGGTLVDAAGSVDTPGEFTSDYAFTQDSGNGGNDALTVKRAGL